MSFVSIIKYVADPQDQLPAIVFWLMGSFASLVKGQVYELIPLFVICYLIIYRLRWKMNVLSLGDDDARIAGMKPQSLKATLLITASILVAASVTIAGVVGWVGLVIPHLVRTLVGYNHGKLIPASALCGALFYWSSTTRQNSDLRRNPNWHSDCANWCSSICRTLHYE